MTTTKMLSRVTLVVLATFLLSSAGTAQSPAGGPALSERAKKGKQIFNDYCYRCHQVDSERAKALGPMGPVLDGLFKKDKLIVGKPVTESNVKEVIKTGPTPGMPGFRYNLSDPEIDDLIEYMKVK